MNDDSFRNMNHASSKSIVWILKQFLQKLESFTKILHIEILNIWFSDSYKGMIFMIQ